MAEVKALAKGLQILDQLREASGASEGQQSVAVTEVARALGVNKSSASRLLSTLASYGYAERDTFSRGYVLGPSMQQAAQSGARTVLRDLARPFLYQLVKLTGECAHTAIHAQGYALVLDDVESAASLRVSGGVGRVEEMHCTAVGKCLLAFMDIPLPKRLPRRTAHTLTTVPALTQHLELIRKQGYALDDEENTEGVRCLAAPIYDHTGVATACIGISGPSVRMTPERVTKFVARVLETSQDLSQSLGFKLSRASAA